MLIHILIYREADYLKSGQLLVLKINRMLSAVKDVTVSRQES